MLYQLQRLVAMIEGRLHWWPKDDVMLLHVSNDLVNFAEIEPKKNELRTNWYDLGASNGKTDPQNWNQRKEWNTLRV